MEDMRHITVVVRLIEEVKEKIRNVETKEESKKLKRELFELQKERQAINCS
ncbi:hypothetical protein HOS99_gp121 [Staphylococcus phage phiSA_BS1]|uniref:Uncharacterized protein n=2 Tax=Baoshanvirus TaxID=2732969 RepID=A0A2P1MXS0_9CAUD|nr:hypothetical protein HOS99_gp121 [Staphylococcus phage phiSA_BS1]YP_009800047.1 hypothetical protein HOT02_gp207 [Staphylococcus phage phiSA_BS2]AVP40362.1 hypothetical protein [Staphylococcus phage phiSA_BS1]AVR55651.1 hypothetical protein phiSABS2_207 [Staphylococcus phage phiSA_BS2]